MGETHFRNWVTRTVTDSLHQDFAPSKTVVIRTGRRGVHFGRWDLQTDQPPFLKRPKVSDLRVTHGKLNVSDP